MGKQILYSVIFILIFNLINFNCFFFQFQSHSIFHCFVVAGAYVHYLGITKLASYRLTIGDCLTAHTNTDFSFEF
jgi:predicted membrane channel-forming protein YqfA (hemolysin III family)